MFDNSITEFQHGIKLLVIELILTILNRIKFDYTMGIKFLYLSKMNKIFKCDAHPWKSIFLRIGIYKILSIPF